jgi:hypothetical protein
MVDGAGLHSTWKPYRLARLASLSAAEVHFDEGSMTSKAVIAWVLGLLVLVGGLYLVVSEVREKSQPALSLTIASRKALLGSGLVVRFENVGTTEIVAGVTARSTTTNQQKDWRLVISPGKYEELGHLQGWAFVSGDEIEVLENGYRPMKFRVP